MVNNFMALPLGFESRIDIAMLSIISVVSSVLMIFVGYKLLQMLQLSGYKLKGYCSWFKETKFSYLSRLFMLTFLSTAAMLMTNVLLEEFFVVRILEYVGILFYFLFSSLFITNLFTAKQKTPLKYTKRMARLLVVYTILVLVASFFISFVGYLYVPYFSYAIIGIIPLILPLFVFLAYFINYPIEKIISNSYLKKAKKKLAEFSNLKVVGITGSYAKTSVKNILYIILSEKFRVCATPSSYNTPLGLSKTILSKLDSEDEIFLAEMGAKQKNDIHELCEMVSPEIGIITGIGNQHLLTFGSVENIKKTKSEIAEFVSNHNGKLFINTDGVLAEEVSTEYKNSHVVSLEKDAGKIQVVNLKVGKEGSSFELALGDEKVKCKTVLLGKHNVSNILLAATVAYELGLTLKEISKGISKLSATSHRLEIVNSNAPYTIIDNAYNSSVEGSKASLELLSKFDGKKIVITPGLIELGKEQFNSNFEFGRDMAAVCDYVIIDSAINYDAISSGLVFAGFDESKIMQAVSLNQAVDLLAKVVSDGDVVLFENDLPDNYS
ncbi:MAG: UDP-N-acetylmuramoyl-tripeptide--D-alanyl-D-alanine ligase [Clostridia bacterium]|nr:UDP-N-acetylmuramoyl-tripeptide--D-alanyl-D-alanine ligase [Clostridia bacterium]